jgi:hypothetical protein
VAHPALWIAAALLTCAAADCFAQNCDEYRRLAEISRRNAQTDIARERNSQLQAARAHEQAYNDCVSGRTSPAASVPSGSQRTLQQLQAGMGIFMNMMQLANMLDRGATAAAPQPDYSNEAWYKDLMQRNAELNRETGELQGMVRGSSGRRRNAAGAQCTGYASTSEGIAQCHQDLAGEFERRARACSGDRAENCRGAMLRAAASALCVVARAPGGSEATQAIKSCLENPGQAGTLLARPAGLDAGSSADRCDAHYDQVARILANNAEVCGLNGEALTSMIDMVGDRTGSTPTPIIRRNASGDFWQVIDRAQDGRWTIQGDTAEPNCHAPLLVRTQRESFSECIRVYVCGLRATACGRQLAKSQLGLACAEASQQCLVSNPVPK